jgi:4-amino-4-deoxy-L-arabinose transferase-like glycosyltransferase
MPSKPQNPQKIEVVAHSTWSNWAESSSLIWWIVLLALLLRAVFLPVVAGHLSRVLQPDSHSYLVPAINLISRGSYPVDNAARTPLYPLFIASIYWIGGQNTILIVAAQIVLGALTVLLCYHLGRKVFSRPVALLGAFLLAASMESITSAYYVLTETLFSFVFLAGMIAWVNGFQGRNKFWLAAAAVLMGLSSLCRPVALYFPVILAFGLLLDRGIRRRGRMLNAALFLSLYLLSLFPWIVRNLSVVGSPTISTKSSYNLLFFEAASLEANVRHVSETQVRGEYPGRVTLALAERGWANNEGNRSRVESQLAFQIILSDPIRFLYVHLKSDLNGLLPDVTGLTELLGVTVGGKGTVSVLNQYGLLAAIRNYFGGQPWLLGLLLPLIIFTGLEYLFSLGGAVELLRQRNWLPLFVLSVTVAYFLILPGAASVPRFRVPVMPYICLLAGAGLQAAGAYSSGWRSKKRFPTTTGQEQGIHPGKAGAAKEV